MKKIDDDSKVPEIIIFVILVIIIVWCFVGAYCVMVKVKPVTDCTDCQCIEKDVECYDQRSND